MRYYVELVVLVREYLVQVDGLTDDDRAEIVGGVIEELSRDADRFFALYPLAQESLCFRYDYPHVTEQAIYTFDFVVDASHLEMGVVHVVYVEYTKEPRR